MSRRREGGAPRRAPRAPGFALILILMLALVVLAAGAASGCGGASDAQLAAYLGSWERVVGGQPDPQQRLVITREGDGMSAEFHQIQCGFGGLFVVEEGHLVCELPDGNGVLPDAKALQLSLDAGGQLVVDQVLADGTTEPVWVYARTSE